MYYKSFSIKKYKGIKEVTLDLANNRIITLVGLNESGKTTILESIHWFYKLIKGVEPVAQDLNSFRPKGTAFTGSIEIGANLILEKNDIDFLNNYWKKELKKRTKLEIPEEFSYVFKFYFDTHKFQNKNEACEFNIKNIKAKKSLKETDSSGFERVLNVIKTNLIPEILFYEDFIFTIPDPVRFLKKNTDNPEILRKVDEQLNKEWQLVLDDILKTVNPKFSSFQKFVADIWDSDNDPARQRLVAMEALLDKKITAAWKGLFQRSSKKLNFKEIKLVPSSEGDYLLNISFKVKTGDNKEFSINERSKGCKWFFSFLIFTEFRKTRTKNILFLLDEPASNLHSTAQMKIREAIGELGRGAMVIYATHSHHLINPSWLKGAHIVINETITEDKLEGNITFDEGAKITAEKYFTYVGKGLGITKISYYQPILDSLDYAPSEVEPAPKIIITEGKNDWYTFKYFDEIVFRKKFGFNFYPGAGKDQHWDILRIYLSWGKKFLLILDGDAGGEKSKEKYVKEFKGFVEDKIFTLKDIFGQQLETEDLIIEIDQKKIIDAVFNKGTYDRVKNNAVSLKSKLNLAINHLLVNKQLIKLNKQTKDNFRELLKFIKNKLCS